MADRTSSEAPVTGRFTVPSQMVYRGELPDEIDAPTAQPAGENVWRNAAMTLAVVLAITIGAGVIFWPNSPTTTVTWSGPMATSTTSATPTRYSGPPPSDVPMPAGDLPGWRMTFSEDFNGDDLTESWYIYDGQPLGDPGGWFMPSHVRQEGGRLVISGSREDTPNGNLYATGGVSNEKSFSQVYGRFDIRFRMDEGYGINYVILLWPSFQDWPPEINIAEDNGKSRDLITSTLHWGGHGSPTRYTERVLSGVDFTQWHTVGVEWTPGRLIMFLDGAEWARYETSNVPSVPMSLALQSQAWYCGGYFSDCPNNTTPPVVNMEVDWVVAYEST